MPPSPRPGCDQDAEAGFVQLRAIIQEFARAEWAKDFMPSLRSELDSLKTSLHESLGKVQDALCSRDSGSACRATRVDKPTLSDTIGDRVVLATNVTQPQQFCGDNESGGAKQIWLVDHDDSTAGFGIEKVTPHAPSAQAPRLPDSMPRFSSSTLL